MIINEKKMIVKAVKLYDYEMSTLKDAKQILKMLFGRLTARDNITHVANMFNDLEGLIEELEDNNNSIIEFNDLEGLIEELEDNNDSIIEFKEEDK